MDPRLLPVGSRYVRRTQNWQEKERRSLVNWGSKHGGRELINKHLDELEGKPVQVFRLKQEQPEPLGPLPSGFNYYKEKLDILAATEVNAIADKIPVGPFVESIQVPVDPKTRALLYEKGRNEYLKERRKLPPYKRYQYPLSINWQAGWWQGTYYANKKLDTPDYHRSHVDGLGARRRKHGTFQPVEKLSYLPEFRSY